MTTSDTLPLTQLAETTCGYLARERSILQSIIAHASEVKQALVARDLPHLDTLLGALQTDQAKRSQLAVVRIELQRDLSEILGIPRQEATLSRLVNAAPESSRQRLCAERDTLLKLVQQANHINRCNLSLALRFSQLTQQLIEALTGKASSPSYGKTGQMNVNQSGPLFQSKF